jgi:predicted metalloprotease with PDZ domain
LAALFSAENLRGALVTNKDSPADRAGHKQGDLIVTLNGKGVVDTGARARSAWIGDTFHFVTIPGLSKKIQTLVYSSSDWMKHSG